MDCNCFESLLLLDHVNQCDKLFVFKLDCSVSGGFPVVRGTDFFFFWLPN